MELRPFYTMPDPEDPVRLGKHRSSFNTNNMR